MNAQAIPSHPNDAPQRIARIQVFLDLWDGVPTLREVFHYPLHRCRPLDRYHALCYAIYEGIEDLFCTDAADYYRLTALLLGEALVAHLDYQWCRSDAFPDEPLQVMRDGCDAQLLHLPGLIASSLAQRNDDALPLLITRICDEYLANPAPYHWFTALTDPDYNEAVYRFRFGVVPNATRRRRICQLLACDEAGTLHDSALLPPLAAVHHDDWRYVDYQLAQIEEKFARQYGANWRNISVNPGALA